MAPLAAAARRTPARWPWAFGVLLLAAALGFGWVHRPDDGPADRWPVSHTAQLAAEHGCLPPDRWSAQIFRGQLQPVGALLIQTSPGRPTQVAHVPAPTPPAGSATAGSCGNGAAAERPLITRCQSTRDQVPGMSSSFLAKRAAHG